MIAQVCGYEAGEFIHTFGDAHIYSNHVEQLELQLSRDIRPLPTMKINPIAQINNMAHWIYDMINNNVIGRDRKFVILWKKCQNVIGHMPYKYQSIWSTNKKVSILGWDLRSFWTNLQFVGEAPVLTLETWNLVDSTPMA